jgi:hypothetical protein
MTKFNRLGLAVVAALGLAACGDKINSDDITINAPQGRVRAVHLSPDAPAVDVLVDGSRVLSGVEYLDASDYLDVPEGTRELRIEPVGSDAAVIEADVPVAANTDYTAIAVNYVADIEPLYLVDDNTAPPTGSARVRVIHGAPSVVPVDVYFTRPGAAFGVPSLTNFAFKDVSTLPSGANYITVPAGRYRVGVTPAGDPGTLAIDTELDVPANTVVTVIARENVGGGAPLGLLVLVDASF